MGAPFDTLAASEALEAAGMDPRQAKACAAQLYAAAGAGEAVTRPELDAALAGFKTEMLERFAETDARIGETNERIASLEVRLTERMSVQFRLLVGVIVAVAGLAVAAMKALP